MQRIKGRLTWAVASALTLLALSWCLWFLFSPFPDKYDERIHQQTDYIGSRCHAYFQIYGRYPDDLFDLTHPRGSEPPLIEGGATLITDPYFNNYQYSLRFESGVPPQPQIWCEREINGARIVIGVRVLPDGTRQRIRQWIGNR